MCGRFSVDAIDMIPLARWQPPRHMLFQVSFQYFAVLATKKPQSGLAPTRTPDVILDAKNQVWRILERVGHGGKCLSGRESGYEGEPG